MDKKIWYTHTVKYLLFILKKGKYLAICDNIDTPAGHYIK